MQIGDWHYHHIIIIIIIITILLLGYTDDTSTIDMGVK